MSSRRKGSRRKATQAAEPPQQAQQQAAPPPEQHEQPALPSAPASAAPTAEAAPPPPPPSPPRDQPPPIQRHSRPTVLPKAVIAAGQAYRPPDLPQHVTNPYHPGHHLHHATSAAATSTANSQHHLSVHQQPASLAPQQQQTLPHQQPYHPVPPLQPASHYAHLTHPESVNMAPSINTRTQEVGELPPVPGLTSRSAVVTTAAAPQSQPQPPAPAEVVEAPPGNLDSLANGPGGPTDRPPYPYSTIIRYAIEGSPRGMLTLSEIYEVVERRYPYFSTMGAGWKNSIRHNLSLNRLFEKKARAITEPGKGAYWIIKKGVEPGPRRVRKRKPRGKKAKAAAEAARLEAEAAAAAAAAGGGPPVLEGDYGLPEGDEYDDDEEGSGDENEYDDEDGLEDEYRPPKRARRGPPLPSPPEASASTSGQPPAVFHTHSGRRPPSMPQYQSYPPPGHADYGAYRHPGAIAYDSHYAGHATDAGGSKLEIDPSLMERPGTRSSAVSSTSEHLVPPEGPPPAPYYDQYGQYHPPPRNQFRLGAVQQGSPAETPDASPTMAPAPTYGGPPPPDPTMPYYAPGRYPLPPPPPPVPAPAPVPAPPAQTTASKMKRSTRKSQLGAYPTPAGSSASTSSSKGNANSGPALQYLVPPPPPQSMPGYETHTQPYGQVYAYGGAPNGGHDRVVSGGSA